MSYIFYFYVIAVILYSIFKHMNLPASLKRKKADKPKLPPRDKISIKLARALEKINITPIVSVEDDGNIRFNYSVNTVLMRCEGYLLYDIINRNVIHFAPIPSFLIPEKRAAVSDFICRVNFRNDNTSILLDPNNRWIYMSSTIPVQFVKEEKSEAIEQWILDGFRFIDLIYPALMSIMYGNAIPSEAFYKMKGQMDPTLN